MPLLRLSMATSSLSIQLSQFAKCFCPNCTMYLSNLKPPHCTGSDLEVVISCEPLSSIARVLCAIKQYCIFDLALYDVIQNCVVFQGNVLCCTVLHPLAEGSSYISATIKSCHHHSLFLYQVLLPYHEKFSAAAQLYSHCCQGFFFSPPLFCKSRTNQPLKMAEKVCPLSFYLSVGVHVPSSLM